MDCFRVEIDYAAKKEFSDPSMQKVAERLRNIAPIHEKSKKAGVHRIECVTSATLSFNCSAILTLARLGQSTIRDTPIKSYNFHAIDPSDGKPYMTFIYRYRPKGASVGHG